MPKSSGRDALDVPLYDEVFLAELELTTAMIIAASECDGVKLCQEQIDRLLGLALPAQRSPGNLGPGPVTAGP